MKFKNLIASIFFSLTVSLPAHAAQGDYNFRFSPLLLVLGAMSLDLDIKVNNNWTLGPSLDYWSFTVNSTDPAFSDFSLKTLGIGARANWFSNGAYTDGLYVGPSVEFMSISVTSGSTSASAGLLVANTFVGYGWFWDSFNMQLGGGLTLPLGSTKVRVDDGAGNTEDVTASGLTGNFTWEWTLGWTF